MVAPSGSTLPDHLQATQDCTMIRRSAVPRRFGKPAYLWCLSAGIERFLILGRVPNEAGEGMDATDE